MAGVLPHSLPLAPYDPTIIAPLVNFGIRRIYTPS